MSNPNELVLCIDAAAIRGIFDAHGCDGPFLPASSLAIDDWLLSIRKAFLPRDLAETDERWRHISTYTLLTDGPRVFAYRRGKSGGEARLHGRLSVGVGGHVTLDDICGQRCPPKYDRWAIYKAAERELEEELDTHHTLWQFSDRHFAGLIADSTTPVEAVHLGAVYRWPVDSQWIEPREDCLADPRWLTEDELWEQQDSLETWSRIAHEAILRPTGHGA